MDNEPEQAAASALDKVAAALAELGQETAAVIAERAGVGYSTATKRLRVLEETGQAEPFRVDDGRTLWRQAANPATTTDAGGDPRHAPAPIDDDAGVPEAPHESLTPAEETGAAAAAGPDDESSDMRSEAVSRSTPDSGVDRPQAPQDPPGQADSIPNEPDATESDGESDEATPAGGEDCAAVETVGEADSEPSPDPAGSNDSIPPGSPTEIPSASTGGKPRRSKGSLRGAILDVLEAHPDQRFKTSELCKAVDKANEGNDSAKASAGAVVNAVHKLIADGLAVQVVEKPAAFQLAPQTD
ncbi:MarR family transcriptional regulator [Plantactinospora sp. S1510]|uniref:MarR family transcriptional regulator n=1 Tax=Plantactinospora alkalitolerans TaxID=2789879 RepID=A0ABS0H8D3_9ACTN|nr:MarR family transcriptional regulator [Plantactinospora alkalitolerans]MBF9134722.1 MarR family transcriptional regulator [Plantactinospora alkalitolerans]